MHLLQNQNHMIHAALNAGLSPLKQSPENAMIKRMDFRSQTQLDVNVASMPYYLCNF